MVDCQLTAIMMQLIILHTLDGHEVAINPEQITNMRARTELQDNKMISNEVACVISLTDGKFISVTEKCDAVRQALENAK